MTIRFLSVCSGIEAASVASAAMGWQAVGFAEIDRAASELLAHRYGSNMPGEALSRNGVPNYGDFTSIDVPTLGRVDVLCGGTPCQAFSIAGKRLSLADPRGNLTLSFAVLAHELARSNGLRNVFWENVPGCLNTADNAFGCFLGALVGHDRALDGPRGRGWPNTGMVDGPRARLAWRVFDAQYFGLAQRRKRVFLVGDFGGGADPAQILFERAGLRGHPPARGKAREGIAGTLSAHTEGGGGLGTDFDLDGGLQPVVVAHGQGGAEIAEGFCPTLTCNHEAPILFSACETADSLTLGANQTTGFAGGVVAHTLRAEGFDASEDGTGRGTPLVPCFAIQERAVSENPDAGPDGVGVQKDVAYTLEARPHVQVVAFPERLSGTQCATTENLSPSLCAINPTAVAFDPRAREGGAQFEGPHDTANIRAASGGSSRSYVAQQWAVRRLTPREAERLQGFPDDYTLVPTPRGFSADGLRYKQLGNSWAVNCVKWIFGRMDAALKDTP